MNGQLLIELVFSVFVGAIISLLYFGGLWLTLHRLDPKDRPLFRLALSASIRLGFIVAAVILAILAGADAWHVLSALLGFLVIRQFLIIRTRSKIAKTAQHVES